MATNFVDDTMMVCSGRFRLQEEREIPPWSSDVNRLEPKRSVLLVGNLTAAKVPGSLETDRSVGDLNRLGHQLFPPTQVPDRRSCKVVLSRQIRSIQLLFFQSIPMHRKFLQRLVSLRTKNVRCCRSCCKIAGVISVDPFPFIVLCVTGFLLSSCMPCCSLSP